jgi:predicted DCC family thiol-disulfide oxidoreductase YuxK
VPSAFGSGHGFLRGMLSSAGWIRPSPMRIWATKRSLQSADSKKKSIQTPIRSHPMTPAAYSEIAAYRSPLLVYDGSCGFCTRSVQFMLRHEQRHDLLFVTRNSELGQRLRRESGLESVQSMLWIGRRPGVCQIWRGDEGSGLSRRLVVPISSPWFFLSFVHPEPSL